MKVGTDGVLIGAWCKVLEDDKLILDIGTGTGLIALMLAQRSNAKIDAIEIDENSAIQANENIKLSKWSQRIDIHNINISHFNNNSKYDLIISNPPFFSDSLLSPDQGRSIARHTTLLTFNELAVSVIRLIKPDGRFCLILPPQESERFDKECFGKLYLHSRCNIRSRVGSDIKRVMSEYRLAKPDNANTEELSIREENTNDYTEQYRTLTADFYLKF